MKIPAHLRISFYACANFQVWIQDDRAYAIGGKDEIDLDCENVRELVEMGLFTSRIATNGPRAGLERISTIQTEDEISQAWADTFTDEPLPVHPGFYARGDWADYESSHIHPAPEGATVDDKGVFESDGVLLTSTPIEIPCLRNEYAETLCLYRANPELHTSTMWPRYRKGVRSIYSGLTTANASMLATLRCVIEDEVYSSGHLYCRLIENTARAQGRYGSVLDSGALYVMLRFGIVEVTQEYVRGEQCEGYGVTPLGLEFYERLMAAKDRLTDQKRYDAIAKAMGWDK